MVRGQSRIDKEFEKKMRKIMAVRVGKRLTPPNPKSIGMPNATRLMLKMPSWKKVEDEMKKTPEKKRRKR